MRALLEVVPISGLWLVNLKDGQVVDRLVEEAQGRRAPSLYLQVLTIKY